MRIESKRYRISITEKQQGGPAGYESVYLTSEGNPANNDLYEVLSGYQGESLPVETRVIRQRNGDGLSSALAEGMPVGIASGFKPSGAYHFGHKLTSETVSFFQKNGAQVFVPVADIECSMDARLPKEHYDFWAADNLLDWGANGVNLDAAHVYLQSEEFRVNTLSYMVARGMTFNLAADIYGAKKLINDFPFLFAGITQVGDILLPQHMDFSNYHSFMVSGQDQDGHMKMTVALTQAALDNGQEILGVKTVPSGFYIPHIRGIGGEKASSSRPEGTLYLGSGPEGQDLEGRIKTSLKKIDEAQKEHLDRCALDMVRYIRFFNNRSVVLFQEVCSEPEYNRLDDLLENALTRNDQLAAREMMDQYLINRCRDQNQDNVAILRDSLPEALTEHQRRRREVLEYAKAKTNGELTVFGGWSLDEPTSQPPSFWQTPENSFVDKGKRTPTQWFHIVEKATEQINP